MNKTNKIIFICIIAIIIIIGVIIGIMINLPNEGTDIDSNTEFEQTDTYVANTNIIQVKGKNKYFAIQKIVTSYFYYIQEMNGDMPYLLDPVYKEEVLKEQQEEGLKVLRNMSYEYYNGKSDSEILEEGKKYSSYDVKIEDMYIKEDSSSINIYFVNILIDNNNFELAIKTDSLNMIFSIFPDSYIKANNSDKEKIANKISNNSIKQNINNQYSYINITSDYIVRLYFNEYKSLLEKDVEKAYKLLDSTYATKRFGNIIEFKKYTQNILNEDITIKEYLVNNYSTYTEYVGKDQYDNLYIFKETAIMQYSVILDTYTLDQSKFNTEYAKASEQKKVMMNIDKFFQMINGKDYKAAYNCLAESFKNNYFKTQENFATYVKSNFYNYNDVSYNTYNSTSSGVYGYELILTDKQNTSNSKIFNIVMKLNSGTGFEMSFEV